MTEFLPPKPAYFQTPWERARDQSPVERLQHCWVTGDELGEVPGLLLEWRETPTGWDARVVRPIYDHEDEQWRPKEEWLPAPNIRV